MRVPMPGSRSASLGGISYGRPAVVAGVEADLPEFYRNAAKQALLFWAGALEQAVDAIHQGDLAGVHEILERVEASYDVSESGWLQGRASKMEALAVLRQALAEAERKAPSWFEEHMGTPPKQVEAFVAAASVIAVRMRARANSGDFDQPAVLTPDEKAEVEAGEAVWTAKVTEDEQRAVGDLCVPARVLTGETSLKDYWTGCVPDGARYAAFGIAGLLLWKLYRWVTR